MKNNKELRELLLAIPASPETDKLQSYLEFHELEFDLYKKQANALQDLFKRHEIEPYTLTYLELQARLILHMKAGDMKKIGARPCKQILGSEAKFQSNEAKEKGEGFSELPVASVNGGKDENLEKYLQIAPKLVPLLLHVLTSNGFFKLTDDIYEEFKASGRALAVKETDEGLQLFLLDKHEQGPLTEAGKMHEL